jgi:hypothetical protein
MHEGVQSISLYTRVFSIIQIMKNTIIAVFILLFSYAVKAEYNGYHFEFTIETTEGQLLKGYVYKASAYLDEDSLSNSDYLIKAFSDDWNGHTDSIKYFKNRIKYNFYNQNDTGFIFYLLNEEIIPSSSVKKIKIDEMIDYGYLSGIANELTLRDTSWMKKRPVKIATAGGYLCDAQIFIHKDSKKIKKLLKEIEAIEAKYNDMGGGNDKFDDEIQKVIEKFKGEKVVIITTCTC